MHLMVISCDIIIIIGIVNIIIIIIIIVIIVIIIIIIIVIIPLSLAALNLWCQVKSMSLGQS